MLLTLALLVSTAIADDRGAVAPTPAADLPGAVMPTRWWDVQSLHLDLRVDVDAGEVSGTATHELAPLAVAHAAVRLHQVGLDISEVRVDGEVEPDWRTGSDFVEIPVEPGKPHRVAVTYRARPQTGLHFRGPARGDRIREVWSQGEGEDNRHWFPGWDHPNDRMTLEMDLTVPTGLVALANGELEGSAPADPGWTRWSYSMPHEVVNYLVAFAAGEYRSTTLDGRIPLEVWTAAHVAEPEARAGLEQVADMLPFYDALIGTPYPYPVYRQVAVQRFLYGGMENTTLTILSDELLVTEPGRDARHAESVAAHELAHQWFGDLLTCYGWRELWLNEGFATHYTNRWMDHHYGPAYAASRRRRSYDAGLQTDAPMAARSWSRVDGRDNTAVYTRGSTVLHMLEVHLGREAFDAGIRRYVAENTDRLVESGDLRRAMEDVSGTHLGWLFDQWVHRPGAPSFEVRHAFEPNPLGGAGLLTVDIEQTTEGTAWNAPVEIEVGTPDGPEVRTVWVGEGKTEVVFELEQAPRWVLADPQRGVLAHWTQHQQASEWVAAAERSETWDGRLEAVRQLGAGDAEPDVVEALRLFANDRQTDPDVRSAGVVALGALGTDEARESLVRLIDDEDPAIRTAAAKQLGGTSYAPSAWRALELRLSRDPHDGVRAAALQALASLDSARAMRAIRKAVSGGRRTPDVVRDAALSLLGRHGDKGDIGKILSYAGPDTSRRTRSAAIDAAARIARREGGKDVRARVSRALEPGLDDADQKTRRATITALGKCGDEQAARRLQAFAKQTNLEGHAKRALDAARDIRKGTGASKRPEKDDLDRVGERIEEIEKRIEELEAWR